MFDPKGAACWYYFCSEESMVAEHLHVVRTFKKLQGDTDWMGNF